RRMREAARGERGRAPETLVGEEGRDVEQEHRPGLLVFDLESAVLQLSVPLVYRERTGENVQHLGERRLDLVLGRFGERVRGEQQFVDAVPAARAQQARGLGDCRDLA